MSKTAVGMYVDLSEIYANEKKNCGNDDDDDDDDNDDDDSNILL